MLFRSSKAGNRIRLRAWGSVRRPCQTVSCKQGVGQLTWCFGKPPLVPTRRDGGSAEPYWSPLRSQREVHDLPGEGGLLGSSPQLEKNHVVPTAWQDEALARDGVSRDAVILEPRKIKSATVSTVSPSICHKVMGPDAMIFVF